MLVVGVAQKRKKDWTGHLNTKLPLNRDGSGPAELGADLCGIAPVERSIVWGKIAATVTHTQFEGVSRRFIWPLVWITFRELGLEERFPEETFAKSGRTWLDLTPEQHCDTFRTFASNGQSSMQRTNVRVKRVM